MSDENNQVNSTGVKTEASEHRADHLEELFDSFGDNAAAAQKTMREIFNAETFNASTNHSPLLQRGRHTKEASAPEDETLTDVVRRLVGRR